MELAFQPRGAREELAKMRVALLIILLVFCLKPAQLLAADLPVVGISTIKATVDDWRLNSKSLNFQAMLETQMSKVGRFVLIERNRVDEILAEQGLNNEFGDGQTSAGGFNVAGVDYLVYGSITKLGQTQSSVAAGQFKTKSLVTEMSVDIRVVDASTGEIRKAESAEGAIKTGSRVGTGNFATTGSAADPLADVQRLVAKKAASLIATSIFPIEVVKGGDTIYLNYGSSILDEGDLVSVFKEGEELIDETTGLNLGSEEVLISELEVFQTTDKFSKARVISGVMPSRGDLARIKWKNDSSGMKPAGGAQGKRGKTI